MITKQVTRDGVTITIKRNGHGSYSLICDSSDYNSPVYCDDSFIFDYIDDEDEPEKQDSAITSALARMSYPAWFKS